MRLLALALALLAAAGAAATLDPLAVVRRHVPVKDLPEEDGASLTASEFVERYASRHQAVVVRRAAARWPARFWTLEYIRERCKERSLVYRCGKHGQMHMVREQVVGGLPGIEGVLMPVALARHSPPLATVADLIDAQQNGSRIYLHDQSVEALCPALLDDIRVPRYFPCNAHELFPQDLVTACPELHQSPSIFIGPEGTGSPMHADAYGAKFWQAVLRGTKLWLLLPKNASSIVATKYSGTGAFKMDVLHPTPSELDLLRSLGGVYAVLLHPGDLIFVPNYWPHQVLNLDATIAVSGTFNDAVGLPFLREWADLELKPAGKTHESSRRGGRGRNPDADAATANPGTSPPSRRRTTAQQVTVAGMTGSDRTAEMAQRILQYLDEQSYPLDCPSRVEWLRARLDASDADGARTLPSASTLSPVQLGRTASSAPPPVTQIPEEVERLPDGTVRALESGRVFASLEDLVDHEDEALPAHFERHGAALRADVLRRASLADASPSAEPALPARAAEL